MLHQFPAISFSLELHLSFPIPSHQPNLARLGWGRQPRLPYSSLLHPAPFQLCTAENIKRTSIPWVGSIDHPNCNFTIARSKVLTSSIYYILHHCNYTRSTSINCFLFGFASHNPSSIHPSLPSPAYLPPTNTFMLNPLQSFPTHPSIIEAF